MSSSLVGPGSFVLGRDNTRAYRPDVPQPRLEHRQPQPPDESLDGLLEQRGACSDDDDGFFHPTPKHLRHQIPQLIIAVEVESSRVVDFGDTTGRG